MSAQPITVILQEFSAGDKGALDRLMPLIYAELRRLANRQLNQEHSAHTLQPTALVHEAYVRLIGNDHPDYRSRAHFLGVAAKVMRQVLIDHARGRKAGKRGAGQRSESIEDGMDFPVERPGTILAVDDALQTLEREDTFKARLIEMRFFGGLTAEESAGLLDIGVEKVRAELRVAQAWLRRELDNKKAEVQN